MLCVDYLPRPTQDWYRVYWPLLSLELGNQCYILTGENFSYIASYLSTSWPQQFLLWRAVGQSHAQGNTAVDGLVSSPDPSHYAGGGVWERDYGWPAEHRSRDSETTPPGSCNQQPHPPPYTPCDGERVLEIDRPHLPAAVSNLVELIHTV